MAGPADSPTSCDFTCTAGFEKHGRVCRPPEAGFWADGGVAKPCDSIANSDWASHTGAVTSAIGCAFSCKQGFTESGRSCNLPTGFFVTGGGIAKACGTAPTSSTGWVADQASLNARRKKDCVFTCAAGCKVRKKGSGGSCVLKAGYFPASADLNSEGTSCGTSPLYSRKWADDQSDVTQAQDCVFICAGNYVVRGTGPGGHCDLKPGYIKSGRPNRGPNVLDAVQCPLGEVPAGINWCLDPPPGFYSDTNRVKQSCGDAPDSSTGWVFPHQPSSVTQAQDCVFQCNTGRTPVGTGSSGVCSSLTCSSDKTPNGDGTQCIPKVRACRISHGTGEESWDRARDDYINCGGLTGCDPGYYEKNSQCVEVDTGYVSADGATTQTQCQGGPIPNEDKSACVTCDQAGFYTDNGICKVVDRGYVSVAGTSTQTQCTGGGEVPNIDKSACEQSDCPLDFIPVPALAGYTTSAFCVAKYEMKNDGSGGAISQAVGTPWANITQADALAKCTALGSGYDLINNDEWQTLARNVEKVASNWHLGQIGSSIFIRGSSSFQILAAHLDDSQVCYGFVEFCNTDSEAHNFSVRRIHILSNGWSIWDLGSNVGEWIKNTRFAHGYAESQIRFDSGELRLLSSDPTKRAAIQHDFWPTGGAGYDILHNFGELNLVYSGPFFRGGSITQFSGGVFTIYSADPDNLFSGISTSPKVGFRCVYHPPTN